jgi:Ran GTPase-activating protein 1
MPGQQVFKLWPPSQGTREAVRQKMALKLSSACFESQSFARIELADAQEHAKTIEEAAFGAAQEADRRGEKTGSAVVMIYAKHASKVMLETLRSQGRENGEPVTPKAPHTDGFVATENGAVNSKGEEHSSDGTVAVNEKELKETDKAFDISGGTRAFLTREYAEELLRPLLEENAFTHVCLSNWSFGDGSAEVAARALSPLKDRLVDVNLADIVAGRPEVEALNAMTIISSALEGSKLKSLNLSDNALGEKGIRAFAALLSSQDSLEALYFMNNGISEDAARAIREILPSSKELRTLRFHNNMSGDQGAVELAAGVIGSAPLLEHFQFSSSRVGSEGGIALMEALRGGKSLRSIDIRDNMYGPDGGAAVGLTLRSHSLLTEVYLSDLGLEDEGALAVVKALTEEASKVTILELGGNEITEKVAPALAACIRSMRHLKRLNLMENELKDKGAVIVSNAIKDGLDNLRELDLSVNEIGHVGAVAAAQAVANKVDFKSLNLNGNQISDQGIEALQDVLAKSTAGAAVLGPLDENEAEEEDQEDDDKDDEDEDGSDNEKVVAGFSDLDVADKDD